MRTRSFRMGVLALTLAPAWGGDGAPAHAGEEEAVVLEDFDAPEPPPGITSWDLKTRRVEAGGGGALELSGWSGKDGRDAGLRIPVTVSDWRKFEALAIGVTTTAGTLDVEIDLRNAGESRLLFRMARLPPEAGRGAELRIPLRDFCDESWGLVASLAAVQSVDIRFPAGSGTVVLDDIRLLPGSRGEAGSRYTLEDWKALGFQRKACRTLVSKSFALLTDSKTYQGTRGTKLLGQMEAGVRTLASRYGVKAVSRERMPVLLFDRPGDYGAFYSRVTETFRGKAQAADSEAGAALLGVAVLPNEPLRGVYEPVAVHEALHLVIRDSLRLATSGPWIQEGLACAVERQFYPEYFDQRFRRVSREAFQAYLRDGSGSLLPLGKVLAQKSVPYFDYTEILTIFDYLAERHKGRLDGVWDAVRRLGKDPDEAGMDAILGAVGMTLEEFEKDWARWGATAYR